MSSDSTASFKFLNPQTPEYPMGNTKTSKIWILFSTIVKVIQGKLK